LLSGKYSDFIATVIQSPALLTPNVYPIDTYVTFLILFTFYALFNVCFSARLRLFLASHLQFRRISPRLLSSTLKYPRRTRFPRSSATRSTTSSIRPRSLSRLVLCAYFLISFFLILRRRRSVSSPASSSPARTFSACPTTLSPTTTAFFRPSSSISRYSSSLFPFSYSIETSL